MNPLYMFVCVVMLAFACTFISIAIIEYRAIWLALCEMSRRLFPPQPEPSSNVLKFEAARRDLLGKAPPSPWRSENDARQVVIHDAFQRFNDYEFETQRPQVH